jgi:hypothetical protein
VFIWQARRYDRARGSSKGPTRASDVHFRADALRAANCEHVILMAFLKGLDPRNVLLLISRRDDSSLLRSCGKRLNRALACSSRLTSFSIAILAALLGGTCIWMALWSYKLHET